MKTLIVYTRHEGAYGIMGRYPFNPDDSHAQATARFDAEHDVEVVNGGGGHAFIAEFAEGDTQIPDALIIEA